MLRYSPLFFLSLVLTGSLFAEPRPFSDDGKFPFGVKPATLSDNLMQSEYERWKAAVLVECNGSYRVIGENSGETRVEGIGFGMLLSAYAADREVFDGLFDFYKSKQSASANQMMAWQVSCDGTMDGGSATDGDIDVAFSLIIAGQQWGENYEEEAMKIIDIMKDNVIVSCGDISALAPGVSGGKTWGGCSETDISYYNPAFFREFARVSGDELWDKLADDTYTILDNGANKSTGLIPDWQSVSGSPGANGRVGYYRYDACRAPYRIAIDYLWNGNEKAMEWCTKISDWAYKQGPANIVDGYNLDGSRNGSSHTSSFTGSFGVAAMCNNQEIADSFGEEVDKLRDNRWFNLCCRCCYLMALTGNQWKPVSTGIRHGTVLKKANDQNKPTVHYGNQFLHVRSGSDIHSIEIVSLSGKRMTMSYAANSSINSFDISALSRGVYFLRVHAADAVPETVKFIRK